MQCFSSAQWKSAELSPSSYLSLVDFSKFLSRWSFLMLVPLRASERFSNPLSPMLLSLASKCSMWGWACNNPENSSGGKLVWEMLSFSNLGHSCRNLESYISADVKYQSQYLNNSKCLESLVMILFPLISSDTRVSPFFSRWYSAPELPMPSSFKSVAFERNPPSCLDPSDCKSVDE